MLKYDFCAKMRMFCFKLRMTVVSDTVAFEGVSKNRKISPEKEKSFEETASSYV